MTDSTEPRQHADDSIRGGAGPQQVVQITDAGMKWVIGLLILLNVIIALCMVGLGYSISEAHRAVDKAEMAAIENAQAKQAFIRLQASLVARGISISEADPIINAPPKPRGTQ